MLKKKYIYICQDQSTDVMCCVSRSRSKYQPILNVGQGQKDHRKCINVKVQTCVSVSRSMLVVSEDDLAASADDLGAALMLRPSRLLSYVNITRSYIMSGF